LPRILCSLLAACTLVGAFAGCQDQPESLQLDDLTDGERLFIERFVTLERAKAVTLVAADAGQALLDSLAAAWGDDARSETGQGLPVAPQRAAAVQNLLARILAAERDSLLLAPSPRRLRAPLPDPSPPPPAE